MKNIILATILILTCKAFSAPDEESKSSYDLMRTYNITKERFLKASLKERKVLSTLFEINNEMKDMTRKKEKLTGKFLYVQSNVKKLAKDIASLENAVEEQKQLLSHRLRFVYKMGDSGSLPLLFSTTSAHDLEVLIKYIKAYAEKDYKVIGEYQVNLEELLMKRDSLKKEVVKLVGLKQKIKTQEVQLEGQQKSKSKILEKIKMDKKSELNRLANIRKKSNVLEGELLNYSFFEKKGRLPWPTKGKVIHGYGLIQDQENGLNIRNKGLYISSEKGSLINIVHEGRVAYVGAVPGHGRTVIIGHGDHYYTVYSQVEGVRVKVGDNVKEGELLGQSGEAMSPFGAGIYFEIRHFSEAIDPELWLNNLET